MYQGDFRVSATVDFSFTTVNLNGVPTQLASSPVAVVYKDNNTTESTAGLTLTVDFDGRTGLNHIRITLGTDATFYSAGSDYAVVLTAGSVSGNAVAGIELAAFSIENRSALMPTVAARTLDVSSGGEAGVDWANVGTPTSTVGLTNTTVKTATDVETDTQDIQSRLPAALVSGRIDASVGAKQTGLALTAQEKLDVNAEADTALSDAGVTSARQAHLDVDISTRLAATAYSAPPSVAAIRAEMDTNSTKLDVTVGSRLAAASYTAPDNADIVLIKAKTDNLPTDPADASDIAGSINSLGTTLGTIAGYIDTEIGDIKAKTDLLPAVTAGAVGGLPVLDASTHVPALVDAVSAGAIDEAAFATVAELATAPATGNVSVFKMIRYLYQRFRNRRTETATAQAMFKDDGTTQLSTRVISDDATTLDVGADT